MPEQVQQDRDLVLWFRYEDRLVSSGVDEWGDSAGPGVVTINLRKFEVIRTTPKGVWLVPYVDFLGRFQWPADGELRIGERARFVRLDARKQYASPTKEAALLAFQARKEAQTRILAAQLANAQKALALSKREADQLCSGQPISPQWTELLVA